MNVVTIAASQVKELRDMTGAGMMDCKRALLENEGDVEAAKDWLRKRGQAIADKLASRAASEGLIEITISEDGRSGVIFELNCVTDFVAHTDEFKTLIRELADQVLAGAGAAGEPNKEELLASPYVGDPNLTVQDKLTEFGANTGEKIEVGRIIQVRGETENTRLQSYIHPPGKLAVLVQLESGETGTHGREEFKAASQQLAMHIAGHLPAPVCLRPDQTPADVVERERAIYRDQALNEGKPEKIVDKIVEGKIGKFYQQICLMSQKFVIEPDLTIQKWIEKISKELGDEIKIVEFVRIKIGE